MTLTYREVTGLWSARVPDGPDSDAHPDTVLLEGHVTFEPEYRVPLVYPGEHIVVEPMHAVIHEGVLYGETVVGDDVVRGPLFLPVTVDENANQTWSWVAKFQGMRLGEYGEEVALPTVRFQVPAGDDALDLSEVIPVSQSGNTITLRGPGLSEEDAQALVDAGLDERGLLPDGSLPSVARAEVEQIVAETAVVGPGIEEVSGTVVLDPDGPRIREFYTVGVTTIGGEDFAPDTALAVRRIASGSHEVAVVGEAGGWRAFGDEPVDPEPGDTTPPTAGTMTVTVTEDSITGTVSGAMDETALHASPYRFSLDGTWTGWQESPEHVWEGLSPDTEYEARHEVRDAAGNTKLGAAVVTATTAVPEWTVLAEETFTGVPDGAFPDGRTIPGAAGLTWELSGDWGAPIVWERIDFAPETNTTMHAINARRATSTMNDVRLSADYTSPVATRRHRGTIVLEVHLNSAGSVSRGTSASMNGTNLTGEGVSFPESGTLTVHWSPRNMLRRVLLNGEEIHSEVHTGGFAAAYGMGLKFARGAVTIDNIRYEEAVL